MSTPGGLTLLTRNTFHTISSSVPSRSSPGARFRLVVPAAQATVNQYEAQTVRTRALKSVTPEVWRLSMGTAEQLDSFRVRRISKPVIGVSAMAHCTKPTLALQSHDIRLPTFGQTTGSLMLGQATLIDLTDHRIFERRMQTTGPLRQTLDLLSLILALVSNSIRPAVIKSVRRSLRICMPVMIATTTPAVLNMLSRKTHASIVFRDNST